MTHLFIILLATVGLCAGASIVARLLPKKPVTITTVPATTPTTVVPVTKETLQSFFDEEKADLKKFFAGFTQPRSWCKAIALGIMFMIVIAVSYCIIKEVNLFFGKRTPPVSTTISNTGSGSVESKTESKSDSRSSNGLNVNIFSGWL